MRYTYVYRTGDGVRRTDALDAVSRDAAFAELRARGIRPIKVVAADGSRENGAAKPVRWRVLAALALFLIAALFIPSLFRPAASEPEFLTSRTRRQVIGDAAVIERGIRTGWADVFPSEGDRFLASFAIPGARAGVRNVTEGELTRAIDETPAPAAEEGIEARQIRAIVAGLKDEAKAYVAAGGTIAGYASRLAERQDAELAVHARVRTELDRARDTLPEESFLSLWEEKNAALRRLGIHPIPLEPD